jgi:hypothetical protein
MPNEDLYYDDGSWKHEHEDEDDDFNDRAMYVMSDLEFDMTQRKSDYDNLSRSQSFQRSIKLTFNHQFYLSIALAG